MEVSNVSQSEFESMFGGEPSNTNQPNLNQNSGFGFQSPEATMFNKTATPEPIIPKEKTPEELEAEKKLEEVNPDDSLFTDAKEGEVKENPLDLKTYFQNRIKTGAFLAFEDDKLETPEDIDALIEANFNHKIENIQEEVEEGWYNSKSNAWKFVAQYAENVENPYELLPLLQGIQNIETVNSLDPKVPEQAEVIIRTALKRRGESPSIIEEQITMFKESNKLEKLAADYQPVLIEEENQKIAQIQKQKELEEYTNLQMIHDIHENAIKVIETPFLGKHKLKKEEKAAVYDLIAQPDEKAGGYKIFKALDNLYANKDFATLLEIALIVENKKAHRNYLGIDSTDAANEKILRKLKDTQTSSTTTVIEEPPTPRLQRPAQKKGDSGFGFFNR